MRDRIFPSHYTPVDANEYKLTKLVMSRRNLRRAAWGGLGVAGVSGAEALFAGFGDIAARLFNANDQLLQDVSTIGAKTALISLGVASLFYGASYIQGKRMYSLSDKVKKAHPENPLPAKIQSDRVWDFVADAFTVATIAALIGIAIPVLTPFAATVGTVVGVPSVIIKGVDFGFGMRMNGEAKRQKRRYEAAHKKSK